MAERAHWIVSSCASLREISSFSDAEGLAGIFICSNMILFWYSQVDISKAAGNELLYESLTTTTGLGRESAIWRNFSSLPPDAMKSTVKSFFSFTLRVDPEGWYKDLSRLMASRLSEFVFFPLSMEESSMIWIVFSINAQF
ncbi:hypothetical protein SDC9_143820 [bioreactor metagenome]|uniref:Uncharacterized protein n=1 Tax=bioreactor metagenome TaxID=1076179 RepID=A0A645E571_9ZZZZ